MRYLFLILGILAFGSGSASAYEDLGSLATIERNDRAALGGAAAEYRSISQRVAVGPSTWVLGRRESDADSGISSLSRYEGGRLRWTVALPPNVCGLNYTKRNALFVDGDGSAYVATSYKPDYPNQDLWRAFAMRVTPDGAVAWRKVLEGTEHDTVYAAAFDPFGLYLTVSSIDDRLTVAYRLDKTGAVVFKVALGADRTAQGCLGDGEGGVYVTGYNRVAASTNPADDNTRAYASRISGDGFLIWETLLPDLATEGEILEARGNEIHVGGYGRGPEAKGRLVNTRAFRAVLDERGKLVSFFAPGTPDDSELTLRVALIDGLEPPPAREAKP